MPTPKPSDQPEVPTARDSVQEPVRIFLQWHGDAEPGDHIESPDASDVTWCKDRIWKHDLEFVAASEIKKIRNEAGKKYLEYVKAYEEAEANAVNSFYEHNQASYWKGRRDALRDILANVASEGRRSEA